MGKVILLNALVTSSIMPIQIKTIPVTLDFVRFYIKDKDVISYIGHESTAALLTQLLGKPIPSSRAMYEPRPGETAIVVKLKRRLEKPEDVKEIKESDVEFFLVNYEEYA
jgi:hypothetical protein